MEPGLGKGAPPQPVPGKRARGNRRLFLVVVAIISAGLAFSAVHTYLTLRGLRIEYIHNRVRDLGMSVSREIRGPRRPSQGPGPSRLSDSAGWSDLLDELIETDPQTISLLALLGEGDQILARSGTLPGEAHTLADLRKRTGREVLLFPVDLGPGRRGPAWMRDARSQPSRLVVGLSNATGDFILRRAHFHLAASGIAILALWVLSFHLARTVDRLLELSFREASERHLANLGRMSAMLAHEIRNPLGAMKGLIQIIREGLPEGHAVHPLIGTVVTEAERLETLVTDLLVFARPGRSSPEDFDLTRLIREVGDLLAGHAAEHGVAVDLVTSDIPVRIRSDQAGLRQVALNVLRNAVEASPRGGRVRVEVGREDNRSIAFVSVLDEGPGLGGMDPDALFEPFRTTKLRGSGLGLPISRQILEGLGGTVRLFDRPEGGAGCRIEVPLSADGQI